MQNFMGHEAVIRERRLGSLLTFEGSSPELIRLGDENPAGCCRDNSFNQCGDCSAQRAMLPLAQIRDAALVSHAPLGCSADFPWFNAQNRRGLKIKGMEPRNVQALSSNLRERDIVMGGGARLAEAVHEANRRFSPRAVFVAASCASGIIGDDMEEACATCEAAIGIPVVPVYCEGFKSMVWTTGFDAAYHGIVRRLVRPPARRRSDQINVFNFSNYRAFTPLLAKMGVTPRYFVHQASVDELATMSESAASTHICETLGTYVAAALEQVHGVPELRSPPPFGLLWTDRWLREIGRVTGREEEAERTVVAERARIAPELDAIRARLAGKTVYAFGGASFCHNMLAIAADLGLKIAGMMGYHHDMTFDNPHPEIVSIKNIHGRTGGFGGLAVCNKQPYQLVKLLMEARPDIVMSRHGSLPVNAVKLGIPTFFAGDANVIAGYDGLLNVGRRIVRILGQRNFVRNISSHASFPYTSWWMSEPDTFRFRKAASSCL
ncbi:MAG: nitrogenase [Deltaproteobacteria bacterium]|jgi:nitrogenase molybdenum-iron protein alpha chain|nr:nitrogenase [Deltaproteobacteria bacterium]